MKGNPKKFAPGDATRREIILCMLRSNEPLSKYEIPRRTGINARIVRETIDDFVRAGLAEPLDTAKHAHIQTHSYKLTNEGLTIALAVSREGKEARGIRYHQLLQQVNQADQKDTPLMVMTKYLYLNLLQRNMDDLVLNLMQKGIEIMEQTGSVIESQLGRLYVLEQLFHDGKTIQAVVESTNQALANLTDREREVVMKLFKNEFSNMFFHVGLDMNDKDLIELAIQSDSDPDSIFAPTICGCGEVKRKFGISELASILFTDKRGTCEVCHKEWCFGFASQQETKNLLNELVPGFVDGRKSTDFEPIKANSEKKQ